MSPSRETRNILLVSADRGSGERVGEMLDAAGYGVTIEALGARPFASVRHDAIIALVDWTAAENPSRVRALKQRSGRVPLLLLAPADRAGLAVQALRHGATDYLYGGNQPCGRK